MYIENNNFNDENNRYPLGSRDEEYIAKMSMLNDAYWRNTEKWHYYNIDNQNMILPLIGVSFLIFITSSPSISWIFILYCILLFWIGCKINNRKLDNDPRTQMYRKRSREFRRNYMKMDV